MGHISPWDEQNQTCAAAIAEPFGLQELIVKGKRDFLQEAQSTFSFFETEH